MKQVTQTLKTGVVEVNSVPIPTLKDDFVLVRNSISVISAGTEKTKIDMGKKSLIQKAKARPDLVKQVLNKIQSEGLKKAIQTVQSRLNSPSPLGYSTAGVVQAVGGSVEGLQPGDRVACGGAGYANHADFVAVPKNLIVKVPDNVTDEEAAFATIGSIALQGLRLAEPKLGETFLVVGLGLLGQIMVQLLRANGCQAIAHDLDETLVDKACTFGALGAKGSNAVQDICMFTTAGHGVDGVLVCAGTSSNQPIELCGEVTREKGRVVVVGAVRMDIPRESFFKKEISVVISRSYGPGRYDPSYEEGGRDYPYAYVRFTEQRNMQSILQLVSSKALDINSLITHRYSIDQAAEAYKLIEGTKTDPYLGIVLAYDQAESTRNTKTRIEVSKKSLNKGKLGVSFYGAGNYATASLIPPLEVMPTLQFNGLATASGRTAQGVAKQFGFAFCASNFDELLQDGTDAIFIATRHDTHASAVIKALNANKHVFVEKPLGLSVQELADIYEAYQASEGQLTVGFNRRYSPLTTKLISHFSSVIGPKLINIRANVGNIPSDHWIQDPKLGGGRLIGEGCHFIDLATAIAGSKPVQIHSFGTSKDDKSALLNDNVIVNLKFANGSIASVTYVADGSKAMAKEQIEVFGGGRSARLNDFKTLDLYGGDSKHEFHKLAAQNKGQVEMLKAWVDSISNGTQLIESEELFLTSLATVMAVESLALGVALDISTEVFFL